MSRSIDRLSPAGLTTHTLSFDEFLRREESWDELVQSSPHPLPFLCHAWLRVWWDHFGADHEFVALVVQDGDTMLAAVPLAVRRARHLGVPVTLGEIVGTGPVPTRGMGLADKADLVVREGAAAARAQLCAELVRLLERIDVLDLKGIESSSSSDASLAGASSRPGAARRLERSVSPYLPLTSSWDDYLGSRSGNFRKHLRKYRRELEQLGRVEVARLGQRDDLASWMSDVATVNAASWKATRGTNLFRHPRIRAFMIDVAGAMARKGRLDLQRLRVNGETVAYELCFDFGGRVFSYNGSYRAELARPSPGTVLTAEVIRSACERGKTEYDMLRGEEGYKRRWSDKYRSELQLVLASRRPRARHYTFWALDVMARLKRSPWLRELDDRVSGLLNRWRHRHEPLDGEGASR